MTPVDQDKLHIPGVQRGNCQQAAVASVLDLPLEAVPNFHDCPEGFWEGFYNFLSGRGLKPRLVPNKYAPEIDDYYLAYGPSPRGVRHAVVCRRGLVVHDPHPSRAGLLEIDEINLIVPLQMSRSEFMTKIGATKH